MVDSTSQEILKNKGNFSFHEALKDRQFELITPQISSQEAQFKALKFGFLFQNDSRFYKKTHISSLILPSESFTTDKIIELPFNSHTYLLRWSHTEKSLNNESILIFRYEFFINGSIFESYTTFEKSSLNNLYKIIKDRSIEIYKNKHFVSEILYKDNFIFKNPLIAYFIEYLSSAIQYNGLYSKEPVYFTSTVLDLYSYYLEEAYLMETTKFLINKYHLTQAEITEVDNVMKLVKPYLQSVFFNRLLKCNLIADKGEITELGWSILTPQQDLAYSHNTQYYNHLLEILYSQQTFHRIDQMLN